MENRQKLVRGGAQLLGGHGTVQFLSLVRNFCVARLISPEDFGVAATFALTIAMLEAIGDLSFDRLLIQDRDGDDPILQAVLQALMLVRGFLMGAAIFLAAGPIADVFDVPEAETAYRWLALVPILKGFAHLDVRRVQRELNFSLEMKLLIASQMAAFAVAVGMAWLWHDYMSVLWGLVAQATVRGLGAHFLAERRYQLSLRRAEAMKALRFGWPLTLNGLVLVLSTQGDRMLIGARLSLTDLAVYSVAAIVVGGLQLPIMKVTSGLTLPWLSAAQGEQLMIKRSVLTSAALTLMALLIFLPFVILGNDLIAVLFGAQYRGPATLAGWLAFAAALRILRGGPGIASMAAGDTRNLMLSNLVRGAGVLLAALVVNSGGGLATVAASMCLGEFAAYIVAARRLNSLLNSSAAAGARFILPIMIYFLISIMVAAFIPEEQIYTRGILSFVITCAAVATLLTSFKDLFRELCRAGHDLSRRIFFIRRNRDG